jgi:hypothetical protein
VSYDSSLSDYFPSSDLFWRKDLIQIIIISFRSINPTSSLTATISINQSEAVNNNLLVSVVNILFLALDADYCIALLSLESIRTRLHLVTVKKIKQQLYCKTFLDDVTHLS